MRSPKDIFLEAIELAPEMQAGYVRDATVDAPELRQQVTSLLQEHSTHRNKFLLNGRDVGDALSQLELSEIFDRTATESGASCPSEFDGKPEGKSIAGRYVLSRQLGTGSFGAVYSALQTSPVKRQVALKILRRQVCEQTVARFEAESFQAALMSHPNIARIYDAGKTEAGTPFLAMELVEGEAVDAYCNTNRLSIEQRIGLFVDICKGVIHAHQKGCIHRDIKPSNVLVAEVDGKPVPKLIDFGIAKTHSLDLALTHTGDMIGSPAYMAPEQFNGLQNQIDTRCDVYGLGVLLNQLLTGDLPFNREALSNLGVQSQLKFLCESCPRLASDQVLHRGDSELASSIGLDERSLAKRLQGDLDCIIAKCLEKSPEQRYQSVGELVEDIESHQRDLPIRARPPSHGYRFRKFLRRNLIQVSATVAALSVSVVVAALLYSKSTADWNAKHQNDLRLAAEQRYEAETARNQETKRLVNGFVSVADRLDSGQSNMSEMVFDLRMFLADAYLHVGEADEASRQLAAAWELSMSSEAEGTGDSSAKIDRARIVALERKAEAIEAFLREAMARTPDAPQESVPLMMKAKLELATLYASQKKWDSAEGLLEELIQYHGDSPESDKLSDVQFMLAQMKLGKGQNEEAIRLLKAVEEQRRRIYGEDNFKTIDALMLLAEIYRKMEKWDEAVHYTTQVCQALELRGGIPMAHLLHDLAKFNVNAGNIAEALKIQNRVCQLEPGNSVYQSQLKNLEEMALLANDPPSGD